jgi:hypothetical protein
MKGKKGNSGGKKETWGLKEKRSREKRKKRNEYCIAVCLI